MSKISRKAAEDLAIQITKSLLESKPNYVITSLRADYFPNDIAKFIKNLADELEKNLTS